MNTAHGNTWGQVTAMEGHPVEPWLRPQNRSYSPCKGIPQWQAQPAKVICFDWQHITFSGIYLYIYTNRRTQMTLTMKSCTVLELTKETVSPETFGQVFTDTD